MFGGLYNEINNSFLFLMKISTNISSYSLSRNFCEHLYVFLIAMNLDKP